MLLIDCPHCGPRNEVEFAYGGQAHVARPEDPYALDDREWAQYLFYRDNPRGDFAERWHHTGGCRKWFNAVRDTSTYEFRATYPAGAPRPEIRPEIRPENRPDIRSGTAAGAGPGTPSDPTSHEGVQQ